MTAINTAALHQYSDDADIVRLVLDFAPSVDAAGIIRQPGKFQGEPIHTVYFWGWLLQGEGDATYADCEHITSPVYVECDCESDILYTTFQVTAGDEEAFPVTLAGMAGREIRVREDSSGFVYSWIPDQLPPASAVVQDAVVGAWTERVQFAPNPLCTVGVCRKYAVHAGIWCREHYGANNGD